MAAEEIQKGKGPEEVQGKEVIQEILVILDWMFRLLHTSIEDVRNDIRWLANRLDRIEKDFLTSTPWLKGLLKNST